MLTKLSDSDISLRDVILLRSDIDFVGVILASQELISLREIWLAQVDSNHRPRAYQARALTT